ncbi:MAG: hypothetical protein IJK47_02685 [Lachnospiraceae bacterium]|nr:hypothetical protein [Lachnospiraceae bacterium]
MSKKEKTVYQLDPFVEWAHRSGRVFMLFFLAYAIAIPIICCIVFQAWPSWKTILPSLLTVLMMLGIQSALEVALYTPILGSSSYLTFATGNIMNLKIPCALNAQKVAGVETNTTAGDAISLISTCVSSIVTILVLFVGLFLMVPLRPFLESPMVSSASNYLLAALFGSIAVGFIAPSGGKHALKNKLLVCILPFVITMVLSISGQLKSSMAMILILVAIPLCILTARILYKKGILYFGEKKKQ